MQTQNKIRVVIVTANALRHHYVANRLIENFDVVGIVSEVKRSLNTGNTVQENEIINAHSRERDTKEREYFGKDANFNLSEATIKRVPYGGANSPEVFNWIKELKPDFIALYGTSLIKDPLLSAFENKIINIHLGLSPYYRGSSTGFWPLVFNEPECVGATIHIATSKVDAGSILSQVRPTMIEKDCSHDVGNKTIISAVATLIKCVPPYLERKINPQPQRLDIGKVFKKKDFNANAVLKMKENFNNGMIRDYLVNKINRDSLYPIVKF